MCMALGQELHGVRQELHSERLGSVTLCKLELSFDLCYSYGPVRITTAYFYIF